jgi:hypothetical protein
MPYRQRCTPDNISIRPTVTSGGDQVGNERGEALIGAFCRLELVRKKVPAVVKILPDLYADIDAARTRRLGEPRRIIAERVEAADHQSDRWQAGQVGLERSRARIL